MMNKRYFWVSVLLSLIAIVVSGIAIACVLPDKDLCFDYQGVYVGVLSLLVTLLIGWNIYTVVDFKREIEDIKKETETKLKNQKDILDSSIKNTYNTGLKKVGNELSEMKSRTDKGEALLQANIATSLAASLNKPNVESEYLFISHSIKAIILWANSGEFSNASTNITFLIKVLDPQQVSLRKSQIKSLSEMVDKIPQSHKIDNIDALYDYISKLSERHD